MSKTKKCKVCGAEVAKSAKRCPQCGAKLKHSFFGILLGIIAVIIVIGIIGGNSGSKSSSTTTKVGEVGSTSSQPAASQAPTQTVFHVGDILHDGNLNIVYVASGEYRESNEFLQPKDGYKYIFIKLAFENTSDTSDAAISSFSFEAYADGYACDSYYGGEDDLSATLSAGRSSTGYVYFQVPVDAKDIEIEYETNWITEKKITFVYEGDLDSGYTIEKNTATTAGALSVGDTTTSKSLNITYLNCFADSSDNPFITPKPGCHYITCEFEFENVSSSDQAVSFYSFDCYADGIVCSASYFRDDAISATLSAGRKARGTVTFEVPDDATTVEVEFLSNLWTSNRVVFNASGY